MSSRLRATRRLRKRQIVVESGTFSSPVMAKKVQTHPQGFLELRITILGLMFKCINSSKGDIKDSKEQFLCFYLISTFMLFHGISLALPPRRWPFRGNVLNILPQGLERGGNPDPLCPQKPHKIHPLPPSTRSTSGKPFSKILKRPGMSRGIVKNSKKLFRDGCCPQPQSY